MSGDFNFFIASMGPSRAADYYLGCCDSSVFIDFNNYDPERIYLVRISFDGYGCCDLGELARPLDIAESKAFKEMMNAQALDQDRMVEIVRKAIRINQELVWEDAIDKYGL